MKADGAEQVRLGRLVIAGLVAGLILNVGEAALHGGILAEATKSAYAALHRSASAEPMHLASLIVLTFAQGLLVMWLYAVVRPRIGSKLKAAVCVGLIAWFLSSLYAAVYLHSGFSGILPSEVVWLPVAWQLFEYPLATLAGAAVYGK